MALFLASRVLLGPSKWNIIGIYSMSFGLLEPVSVTDKTVNMNDWTRTTSISVLGVLVSTEAVDRAGLVLTLKLSIGTC